MSQSYSTIPCGTDISKCYNRLETVDEDIEAKPFPTPIASVTYTFGDAPQLYSYERHCENPSSENVVNKNSSVSTLQSQAIGDLPEEIISDNSSPTLTTTSRKNSNNTNKKNISTRNGVRRKMSLQPWLLSRQSVAVPADCILEEPSLGESSFSARAPTGRHRKLSLPQLIRSSAGPTSTPDFNIKSMNVGKALKRIKRVVFSSIGSTDYRSPFYPFSSISISNVNNGQTEECEGEECSSQHSGICMGDIPQSDDLSINNGFATCDDGEDRLENPRIPPEIRVKEHSGSTWESMIVVLSAMYCKLLVVFGLALPMSEFISADIPPLFFHGFYLYLYGMSVAFLLFVYTFLLRDSVNTNELGSSSHLNKWNTIKVSRSLGRILRLDTVTSRSEADLETGSQISRTPQRRPYMVFVANYGSFYLRSGAVLFGIGSMIYSGLEIGQYFDVSHACQSVVMVATPALKLIFTFIQMYFVFLNASMSINKHKVLGRFGLMHMVATNLCTWLNVVIEETKHELDHLLGKHGNDFDSHAHNDVISGHVTTHTPSTNEHSSWHGHDNVSLAANVSFFNGLHDSASESNITSTGAPTTHLALMAVDCGRDSIMGKLVNSVSPFLFPCSIEYSLICAATLYVMWKHLNKLNTLYVQRDVNGDRARKHHYSVDCASASKGLFLGILVFVATVISLILFFVLINNPSSRQLAIHSASATEIILYTLTSMAILIGILQVQKLTYHPNRNMELDNILLVAAQSGVFLYAVFNIIGAYFMSDAASLATGVMSIIQVTLQTMFILDTSHRQVFTSNQVVQKPGREVVTFLLISNLAMWATNTFETSRSDAHPEQLHFYGFWAWTVISHVSMPLAIFYRFHCTVCLCEIWKRAYKQKTIA